MCRVYWWDTNYLLQVTFYDSLLTMNSLILIQSFPYVYDSVNWWIQKQSNKWAQVGSQNGLRSNKVIMPTFMTHLVGLLSGREVRFRICDTNKMTMFLRDPAVVFMTRDKQQVLITSVSSSDHSYLQFNLTLWLWRKTLKLVILNKKDQCYKVSQSVTKCHKVLQSSLNTHLEMVVVCAVGYVGMCSRLCCGGNQF